MHERFTHRYAIDTCFFFFILMMEIPFYLLQAECS